MWWGWALLPPEGVHGPAGPAHLPEGCVMAVNKIVSPCRAPICSIPGRILGGFDRSVGAHSPWGDLSSWAVPPHSAVPAACLWHAKRPLGEAPVRRKDRMCLPSLFPPWASLEQNEDCQLDQSWAELGTLPLWEGVQDHRPPCAQSVLPAHHQDKLDSPGGGWTCTGVLQVEGHRV